MHRDGKEPETICESVTEPEQNATSNASDRFGLNFELEHRLLITA